jgi:hypothetical protein
MGQVGISPGATARKQGAMKVITRAEAREQLLLEIEEQAGPIGAHSPDMQEALEDFERAVECGARADERRKLLRQLQTALDTLYPVAGG